MKHTLSTKLADIIAVENQDTCRIIIADDNDSVTEIELKLEELHSFIGTLLHVQQRLKANR